MAESRPLLILAYSTQTPTNFLGRSLARCALFVCASLVAIVSENNALLALEDGSLFDGFSVGVDGTMTGEVVFNTALSGYQEILTDPSYRRQIITFTCPHIGNVGTNPDDLESDAVHAAGALFRDATPLTSNWRSSASLGDFFNRHQVVAMAGVDTRRLTRHLREHGALRGAIIAGEPSPDRDRAVALAREFPGLRGMDLAREVSTPTPYSWEHGSWRAPDPSLSWQPHVVAYDFGVKRNILRMLVDRGCRVTVIPATTPADEVLALAPDGLFLSNGPGDPEPCGYAISAIDQLLKHSIPTFGICLGHQLLSLACGARTTKMKFGHHGANHPVIDLASGRVAITSQNHGFAVDEASLPDTLRPTHRSLFDHSLQGVRHRDYPAFAFQGHPEASPGPHDVAGLFDQFVASMHPRGAKHA